MSSNVLKILCCPACGAELCESESSLVCSYCGYDFPVKNGVYILVDFTRLSKHSLGQIEYFENESVSDKKYILEAWQEAYLTRFNRHFSDVRNKIVVDCGTGSGYMAIELAKRGAKVIACDLTLKSLLRLRQTAQELGIGDNILCICCSAEQMPLKRNVVDFFISNAVLEHLPDEEIAIQEMERICRTDKAGLMIAVPLDFRYINPILLPINFVHDKRIGHLRRYTELSLKSKLVNFQIIKTYYTGHFWKVIKTMMNMLLKSFDTKDIEKEDEKKENTRWGASNIVCFFVRKI